MHKNHVHDFSLDAYGNRCMLPRALERAVGLDVTDYEVFSGKQNMAIAQNCGPTTCTVCLLQMLTN